MSANILMVSDTAILERTSVHGNIDPQLLYPTVKVAQDMFIHPILGSTLFDKVLSDIESDSLTGIYKTLVDRYITDALIYYVLSELPESLSYQFWNKGVLRQGSEFTEQPTLQELMRIGEKYRRYAEWYAERLKRYLKENRLQFPEYDNPANGLDVIQPSNATFTLPIYLEGWGCDDCDAGWDIPRYNDPTRC